MHRCALSCVLLNRHPKEIVSLFECDSSTWSARHELVPQQSGFYGRLNATLVNVAATRQLIQAHVTSGVNQNLEHHHVNNSKPVLLNSKASKPPESNRLGDVDFPVVNHGFYGSMVSYQISETRSEEHTSELQSL